MSAFFSDLFSRSMSFLIDTYYWQQQGVEEDLQRLHRLLLRIQTIVEEAYGRCITNQAMLLQLQMMRRVMYRGYYMLDNFRYQIVPGNVHEIVMSQSSPAKKKQLCISTRTREMVFRREEKKELEKMLGSLENIIADMEEFVIC